MYDKMNDKIIGCICAIPFILFSISHDSKAEELPKV